MEREKIRLFLSVQKIRFRELFSKYPQLYLFQKAFSFPLINHEQKCFEIRIRLLFIPEGTIVTSRFNSWLRYQWEISRRILVNTRERLLFQLMIKQLSRFLFYVNVHFSDRREIYLKINQ